ncbi:MAG TPA: choice-of-anchor D domain-containing protein [Terriglobia bacterium]|nr:choice-of-anchor D domain-containing protein [Terriglobia bacterium]
MKDKAPVSSSAFVSPSAREGSPRLRSSHFGAARNFLCRLLWVGSLCGALLAPAAAARSAAGPGFRSPSQAPETSQIAISPASLSFAKQQIWTTSAAQTVTVTNSGATVLNLISIVASGDYSQTNTCGTSLQPSASCQVTVTFTPSASGQRNGFVTLNDSDATILQTVTLSGSGSVLSSKLAVSPGVASITFAQTEQYQATLSGVADSNVTWSVDGIVDGNSTVGTISTSGLYTPPSVAGPHTISGADIHTPSAKASAHLVVTNNPGVFTWDNDSAHTGQNLNEIVLATGNVNSKQFGKLFTLAVDGQVYAQPLYVQGVSIPGQGTHNVLYVATENDSVYAFDADGLVTTLLWQVSFINPPTITIFPSSAVNCTNIGSQVGITGTPVIDPVQGVLYVVAATDENGTFYQRLHALDITTGAERFGGPVPISASVVGKGSGSVGGMVAFNPVMEDQRPGLSLVNGVVYLAWASYCDDTPFHGWLMGYNSSTLQQVAVWLSTPNGNDGGMWQGGASPAVDASGNLYLMTGNGTFDASTGGLDYGDTIAKFSTASGLTVTDYFTPYDQQTDKQEDRDVGSGGALLIPDQPAPYTHLLVGAGKEGTVYLVNRDDMGGYNPSNNSQIVQWLTGQVTAVYSTPAFWLNNIYYAGTTDYLKQFQLYNDLLSSAAIEKSSAKVGYPGATPAISANSATGGIVWILNDGGFQKSTAAILYAYDAANVSRLLYNSGQNATRDQAGPAVKFNPPTVVNGKVYVGTNGEVDVYGLLP